MYKSFIKRVLDIIFALIGSVFVVIFMIPVAIAIKIEDGGPIFFNGKRLGRDLKEFNMYKFRSMQVDAPDIRNEDGSTYSADNDPRVTKVGKFIRRTSIDELPQIFNVLKGDMSFVGPRPSPLGNEHTYPKEYFKKFTLRPGITGYNQAIKRNSATMEERIENDLYYVENISLLLDIKIVLKTVGNVLLKENINKE